MVPMLSHRPGTRLFACGNSPLASPLAVSLVTPTMFSLSPSLLTTVKSSPARAIEQSSFGIPSATANTQSPKRVIPSGCHASVSAQIHKTPLLLVQGGTRLLRYVELGHTRSAVA